MIDAAMIDAANTFARVTLICTLLFLLIKFGPARILRFVGLTFWSAGEWWDKFVAEIRLREALRAANNAAVTEFTEGAPHV